MQNAHHNALVFLLQNFENQGNPQTGRQAQLLLEGVQEEAKSWEETVRNAVTVQTEPLKAAELPAGIKELPAPQTTSAPAATAPAAQPTPAKPTAATPTATH